MTLVSGTYLGPYEILAPLGAGGMGEVYRARDTRLGRDVAVKVLSSSLSTDGDRLRRFEQEACAAGALNQLFRFGAISAGADKRQRKIIDVLLCGPLQVVAILFSHRRNGQSYAG